MIRIRGGYPVHPLAAFVGKWCRHPVTGRPLPGDLEYHLLDIVTGEWIAGRR